MIDPNNVIHLPSGDELRPCVECGCAVLDAPAHREWHIAMKQAENETAKFLIAAIGVTLGQSHPAPSEDEARLDPLRGAYNRFYLEHGQAPVKIEAGTMLFEAIEARARQHVTAETRTTHVLFKGCIVTRGEDLGAWDYRLIVWESSSQSGIADR